MISEITNRLRGITFSLEEAESLHKAIDGRTRPQPAVVTQAHAYAGSEKAYDADIPAKSENAVHLWHVAVVVDDLDTYCEEFIGEKAAHEVLGKFTKEINEAIKHDIALVRFGNASFRPEDVAAIEVHGA